MINAFTDPNQSTKNSEDTADATSVTSSASNPPSSDQSQNTSIPKPPSFPAHNPIHLNPVAGGTHMPKFPDPTKNFGNSPAAAVAENNVLEETEDQVITNTTTTSHSDTPPTKNVRNWKTIAAAFVALLVIIGSGAGFYLTQYTTQDVRQQAAGIGETITVDQGHQTECIKRCKEAGQETDEYCQANAGIYVRHYKCDDVKTGDNGCNANGSTVCGGGCTGQTFGFDQGQQCGTQQIDLGCATPQGTVPNGLIAHLSYWGQNACTETPTPTPVPPQETPVPTPTPTPTATPTPTPTLEPAFCEEMTGTLKTVGTVATETTVLDYAFKLSNPASALRIEPTINPIYAGNSGWVQYVKLLPPFPANASGTVTFKQLRDRIIAAGQYTNIAEINSKGIMMVANVIQADGSFCDGGGKWVGGPNNGQACTNKCLATVKLMATTPPPVACNDSCVYGANFDSCTTKNPLWSCQMVIADPSNPNQLSARCRLTSNPSSSTCEEAPPTQEVPPACVAISGTLRATNPLVIQNTTAAKTARYDFKTTVKHGSTPAVSVEYVINKVGGTKQPVIMGARDQITTPNPLVIGQQVTVPVTARTMSFGSWETALAGNNYYTRAELQRDGISYYARVRDSAQNYCDLTGLWAGGPKAGTPCTPQPLCSGSVKLAAAPPTTPPVTAPPTTPPATPAPLVCNSVCNPQDLVDQCTAANKNWACDFTTSRCRFATNPTSTVCQPPVNAVDCNEACTSDDQCELTNSNYSCDSTTNTCRLSANPSSLTCDLPPTPTPTPTPTPVVTPTPTPAPGCNDPCFSNADCSNSSHICVTTEDGTNRCRLESSTDSASCTPPQATEQPQLPTTLPETGPEDWMRWLQAGLVTLGIGTFLFLLL